MNVSNYRIFHLIITKAHYDVAKEERDGKGGFSANSRAIATPDLVDPFVILYAPKATVALVFVLLLNPPFSSLSSFTTSRHFSRMSRFNNYSEYQIL